MRKISIFLTVSIIAIFFSQVKAAFAEDDRKMFNFYQIKYKVNDKLDIFVQPDIRIKDDMKEFNYYHFRNGAIFHAFENLDLGITYRFLRSKNSANKWLTEHRLELEATPKITIEGFKLANRSRFEYRGLEDSRDRWRYRNLSKVAYPTKIGNFEFIPYVSEEFFCDFEIGKIHLNWATLGVDKKITKNLLVGLFYLNEAVRVGTKDEWDTNHILGTKVALSF